MGLLVKELVLAYSFSEDGGRSVPGGAKLAQSTRTSLAQNHDGYGSPQAKEVTGVVGEDARKDDANSRREAPRRGGRGRGGRPYRGVQAQAVISTTPSQGMPKSIGPALAQSPAKRARARVSVRFGEAQIT